MSEQIPVVLLTGMAQPHTADVAEAFSVQPRTAVVQYNLGHITEGIVRRRLQLGARDEVRVLELGHGCVSCTLREDMLPLLCSLATSGDADRIVVRLDEAMEPEQVCYAMERALVGDRQVDDFVELEAVLTVIDQTTWLADATGDAALTERGLQASPEDERTLAQVAVSQVEFADAVLIGGQAPDAWTAARTQAVLERLAPTAPRFALAGLDVPDVLAAIPADARRGEITDPHGPLLRGQPPLSGDSGIDTVLFSDPRPFHPERLHAAIDVLLDGVVRTRGRVWLATQPDTALWLESAGGGLGVGHAGPWLDSPDAPAWDDVPADRRATASMRWHPEFADRAQDLVIVTHRASAVEIETALTGALLTDDELAAGPQAWARYDDPFGRWHEEPCEDTETPDSHADAARKEQQ